MDYELRGALHNWRLELAGAGGCGTFAFVRLAGIAIGAGAWGARRAARPQLKRDSLGAPRPMFEA